MIGLTVEPDLKEQLQKLANEENRNLSNFCLHAVLSYVKEHKDIDLKKGKK